MLNVHCKFFFSLFFGGGEEGVWEGATFQWHKAGAKHEKIKRDQVMTGNGSSFQGGKKKREISADYKE